MGNQYTYLVNEDKAFAAGFNLSEETVLNAFGGLAGYVQHRIAREQCRDSGKEIPPLPTSLTEKRCSDVLALNGVDEVGLAQYLLSEQKQKVKGVQSAIKVDADMAAAQQFHEEQQAAQKDRQLKQLRQEGARKFGVGVESQTAGDYATQQWERRFAHPNQYLTDQD